MHLSARYFNVSRKIESNNRRKATLYSDLILHNHYRTDTGRAWLSARLHWLPLITVLCSPSIATWYQSIKCVHCSSQRDLNQHSNSWCRRIHNSPRWYNEYTLALACGEQQKRARYVIKRHRVVSSAFLFFKPNVAGSLMGHARALTRKLWKLTMTICEPQRTSGNDRKGGRKGWQEFTGDLGWTWEHNHLPSRRHYRFPIAFRTIVYLLWCWSCSRSRLFKTKKEEKELVSTIKHDWT